MEHPPPRIVSFVHSIDSQIPPTFILAAPPAPASSAIPGEPQIMFSSSSAAVAANPLKRLASSTSFESSIDVGMSRKRIKSQPNIQYDAPVDGHSPTESTPSATPAQSYQSPKGKGKSDDSQFADSLYEELKCGCCTELCYNPVLVLPCQHFFCGSCCTLWFRHGGKDCPQCRTSIALVVPARAIQTIIDILLAANPSKARTQIDRAQADEVYTVGSAIRLPAARPPTPEPNVSSSGEYVRPCPTCRPHNEVGWVCPQPIPDPVNDPEHAWRVDQGSPPGHAWCGNCDSLHAVQSPISKRCDFCLVSFCGTGVPGRCASLPLVDQGPQISDLQDLLLCEEIVEIFHGNFTEVDYLLEHLQFKGVTPRLIYREIVSFIRDSPAGFTPLIEDSLFSDLYSNTDPQPDPNPDAPRQRICRLCATEIFLYGILDWWGRERQGGSVSEAVMRRATCADGFTCQRQGDGAHAKEFNHIITPSS